MKILIFAPHNDDEVLGVGGTIAKLANEGNDVYICEVTIGINEKIVKINKKEALAAHKVLGVKDTIFLDLPVVELKHVSANDINSRVLKVVSDIKPEMVFIPHKGDIHADHRAVVDATMVALRPESNPQLKAIYAYETLSETEWNIPSCDNAFIPNVWSDISDTFDIKMKAMRCYDLQIKHFPHPRSLGAIEALSMLRGSTICVNRAESFMAIRTII